MSRRLIAALQSPASYPHETSGIRVLETHISWVVLTGPYAYKIKKPVNPGFLDFSTLEKRRHFCQEELRLNSRFSRGLYLEVAPITGSEDAPCVGGRGEAIEYAVKMRQFDQEDLLDRLAARGEIGDEELRALAAKLARFHEHGAARLPAGERELGGTDSIRHVTLENFRQIEAVQREPEALAVLARVKRRSEEDLAALRDVMDARRAGGFVRECHGDLHLANIARIDGEITFFDCIEFSPRYRWIDTMSELAFLLMDMEEKGLGHQANRVLNLYLEQSGDYGGLAVLAFYQRYRAMVRAKVRMLRLAEGVEDADESIRLREEYARHVALADSYGRPPRPFLALTHGVSGTGKSTVAAILAGQCGAIRLRSDVERKRLYGLAPDAPSAETDKASLYTREASDRTFASLQALARELLALGQPVIVDATFIAAARRKPFQRLAQESGVPFAILECRAPETVILERLRRRAERGGGASDADAAVMRSQLSHVDPFSEQERRFVWPVDTEKAVDAASLRAFLEGQ